MSTDYKPSVTLEALGVSPAGFAVATAETPAAQRAALGLGGISFPAPGHFSVSTLHLSMSEPADETAILIEVDGEETLINPVILIQAAEPVAEFVFAHFVKDAVTVFKVESNGAVIAKNLAATTINLPVHTVGALPSASISSARLIYVSNETDGPTLAFSDGTNWRRVQDRNIVS